MLRKGLHRGPTTMAIALLAACGGMKDPGSVADKFVDRYYVEADQDSALPLTTGIATMRLEDELKLTKEAGQGASRAADYELDIRPQGGGDLQRGAHLTLAQQPDGTWRVSDFSESQPR